MSVQQYPRAPKSSTTAAVFLALSLILSSSTFAAPGGKNGGGGGGGNPAATQLDFLHQQAGASGLLDSFPEDGTDYSYTYDNALAAMAFLVSGETLAAQTLLDAYLTVGPEAGGGYLHRYSSSSGLPAGGLLVAGHNAYLLQAMNTYYEVTGDPRYNALAVGIADYILSLQDADGGIVGKAGVFWKSTENNLACYAAIHNLGVLQAEPIYVSAAAAIQDFIVNDCWDGVRFLTGENDPMIVTDAQALGVMAMGSSYLAGAYWVEGQTLNTKKYQGNKRVTGFDLNTDKDTVWTEGTLQQSVAFLFAGDATKAAYYKGQAAKLIRSSGALWEASNAGTTGFGESFQKWEAVAPTCWYIFADLGVNPLGVL